jgi:NAD(P)-dependent dehydrogenase (short-subunit alcohol dehydrogenase family)
MNFLEYPMPNCQAGCAPVALVTGAGVQLGREIALGLARAGWDICVHYGRSAEGAAQTVTEIEALGRKAVALRADFSDASAVAGVVRGCREALGIPNVLVNSASLFEHDTGKTFDPEFFRRVMDINLSAPLTLSRAMYETWKDEGATDNAGVIINILDQKLFSLNPDHLAYTLSKAGLSTATQMLAQTFAPLLRVAAVAPGLTMRHPAQPQWEFDEVHKSTPLRRGSTPADVAQAVVFLASNQAITGTTLVVDGGQHLVKAERDTMFAFGAESGEPRTRH